MEDGLVSLGAAGAEGPVGEAGVCVSGRLRGVESLIRASSLVATWVDSLSMNSALSCQSAGVVSVGICGDVEELLLELAGFVSGPSLGPVAGLPPCRVATTAAVGSMPGMTSITVFDKLSSTCGNMVVSGERWVAVWKKTLQCRCWMRSNEIATGDADC